MNFHDNDKPDKKSSKKSLVPYSKIPEVPPPPPPDNFINKFDGLVTRFEQQVSGNTRLYEMYEKRNAPVEEFAPSDRFLQTDWPSNYAKLRIEAVEKMLDELEVLWPGENIMGCASREAIGVRLHAMRQRLPKGDETEALNFIERVEAEAPSVMVLESTCRQLEDTKKQFPLPADILPVLREQKEIWDRRMYATDVGDIKSLGDACTAARQEQRAIFEKALREGSRLQIVPTLWRYLMRARIGSAGRITSQPSSVRCKRIALTLQTRCINVCRHIKRPVRPMLMMMHWLRKPITIWIRLMLKRGV